MTYRQIVAALRQAEIPNAEYDARLLIEHFCNLSPEKLLSEPDSDLPSSELQAAVQKRMARVPLQYLIGEWQFFRQTYRVTPDCLIPRQDTESLVEKAIQLLPPGAFFADLCTGSGCIAVSVLCERPDTRAVAIDLSDGALQIAAENAKRNGVADRLILRKVDLLEQTPEQWAVDLPHPDTILSNPPYIPTGNLAALSREVHAEPQMALDGGKDGLQFYRRFLAVIPGWLKPDGVCLFEIGFDQRDAVCRLAAQQGFSCQITKDLGGNDRVAIIKKQI